MPAPVSPTSSLPLSLALPCGAPVRREQAQQRHRGLRLARPRLTHDRQHLAGVDVVADVPGGGEPLAVDVEGDVEVPHLENRALVLGYDGCRRVLGLVTVGVLTSCLSILPSTCRHICQGGAMGPTVLLRSRSTQALGAAMVVASVAGLASVVLGGTDAILQFAAPLALFGVLGWGAFWQPRVEVSDGGVTVVNTLRTVEVPWPAVQSVDGRYGLRLETAYGRVTAWGAAAPAGRQRARGVQSAAAAGRPSGSRRCATPATSTMPGSNARTPHHLARPAVAAAGDARPGHGRAATAGLRRRVIIVRSLAALRFLGAAAAVSAPRGLGHRPAEGIRFCRGSKASRRPSPMKFTDSAMIMMNRPGHQNSQGRVENADWYSEIIVPSDTSGALMPKPR